jgi:hypothetical protein
LEPLCDILHSHRGCRLLYREILLLVTTKPTPSFHLHNRDYVTAVRSVRCPIGALNTENFGMLTLKLLWVFGRT